MFGKFFPILCTFEKKLWLERLYFSFLLNLNWFSDMKTLQLMPAWNLLVGDVGDLNIWGSGCCHKMGQSSKKDRFKVRTRILHSLHSVRHPHIHFAFRLFLLLCIVSPFSSFSSSTKMDGARLCQRRKESIGGSQSGSKEGRKEGRGSCSDGIEGEQW